MSIIKCLIRQHKYLFSTAAFITLLSIFLNLCWNQYLMELLDRLTGYPAILPPEGTALRFLKQGIRTVLPLALSEFASSCLAARVCETFAHDLRMGYVRYYLQSDIRTLAGLRAGEEQSAMQNELADISNYFHEKLFSFMKQFVTFTVTVLFLLCQNRKLTVLSTLPVFPLIAYCFFTGRIIKGYAEQCQRYKKQVNGLADILLELFPVIWVSGLLSFLSLLLLLGFGGTMAARGEISIGTFYIFINLSGQVSGFLQNMPNAYAGFRKFEASVGALEGKLALEK